MREFRLWVKIGLFASAYIPFFAIMAILNLELTHSLRGYEVPVASVFFVIVIAISSYVLWKAVSLREEEEPKPKQITSLRRRNDLLTSYLIAYVFPFVGLDYSMWEHWVTLGIFFIVLAAIQIRSDQLHINPILAILGYDIYEIEDGSSGNTELAIVPRSEEISIGSHIDAVRISSGVYLAI